MAAVFLTHRQLGKQISLYVEHILTPHGAIRRIGKGWIIGSTRRRFAVPERLDEIGVAPGADSGLRVRRNIARIEIAVRRGNRPSAGQERPLARLICVATDAAGGAHEIFAAHRIGRLGARRREKGQK